MLRVWKWYQNCLATHPVKTQVISSAFIWGFGDIAAQTVTHSTAKPHHVVSNSLETNTYLIILLCCEQLLGEDKELKINWRRVASTSLFGLAFIGPVGHFWSVFHFQLIVLFCFVCINIIMSFLSS
ncbi:hypothetical protein ACJIZ3_004936 [Penstemon smallii]|uniref:Uncharacterized protein n=1 Tax=Penstemon smallii TaxID=265156 RepID=A0ABD3S3G6_9LAMI